MNKNQKGFSVVEGMLILVIVGIIGGVGYFVYNSQKQTNMSLDNASKEQATANITKTTKTTQSSSTITIGAITLVAPKDWIEKKDTETTGPSPNEKVYVSADFSESEHPIGSTGVDSGANLTVGRGYKNVTSSVLEDYKEPKFAAGVTQLKIDGQDAVRWYTAYEDSCYSMAVTYKDSVEYNLVIHYSCDDSSRTKYEPILTSLLDSVKFQ